MTDEAGFDVIAIIGVGLIGGSLGMAARERGLVKHVIGIGRNETRLERAKQLQAIDEYTLDRQSGVEDADLVVICTPVGEIVPAVRDISSSLKPGAIVTDVGSTKTEVVLGAEAEMPDNAHFVGGHPMAGSDATGVVAGRADLFEGAAYVITPTERTDLAAMNRLRRLADALGARTLVMSPQEHDYAAAVISHVPHVLAAAALAVADEVEEKRPGEIFSIAAGSFRDLTRVAGSSPELWRDICLSNRDAIVSALSRFEAALAKMHETISLGNAEDVEKLFQDAKRLREELKRSNG